MRSTNTSTEKKNVTGRKPIPRKPSDNTTSLAIKIYDEQCVDGSIDEVLKRIVQTDKKRYEIYAIVHDKTEKNICTFR